MMQSVDSDPKRYQVDGSQGQRIIHDYEGDPNRRPLSWPEAQALLFQGIGKVSKQKTTTPRPVLPPYDEAV